MHECMSYYSSYFFTCLKHSNNNNKSQKENRFKEGEGRRESSGQAAQQDLKGLSLLQQRVGHHRVTELNCTENSGVLGVGLPTQAAIITFFLELRYDDHGVTLVRKILQINDDLHQWWAAVHGVAKSGTRLSNFPFTFHFHALEKEMATHSSVLAWKILGMGEPGGLPSMGSHRVRHD